MDTTTVNVPLRAGGKKMRKRRELDALVIAKRQHNRKYNMSNGIHSQDQLLSASTDELEETEWPKVTTTSRSHNNKKCLVARICAPFIILICLLSFCFMYFFYDLRQQLYEYRQKVEQVSVSSQNLPEALQKWHETTKFLEQNQTKIFEKISKLQQNLEEIQKNLTDLQFKFNEKNSNSNNEKYVAEFGAQLRAMSVDVDVVKEKLTNYQKDKNDINQELQTIKNNISNLVTPTLSNTSSVNCTEEISNLEKHVFNELKSLKFNLTLINDTLSQKVKNLNDEQVVHKNQIDEFLERSANTTSHVKSIEDDWTKNKQIILNWEANRLTVNTEISNLKNITAYMDNSIADIRTNLIKFHHEMDQNIKKIKEDNAKNRNDNLGDIINEPSFNKKKIVNMNNSNNDNKNNANMEEKLLNSKAATNNGDGDLKSIINNTNHLIHMR